MKLNDVKNDIFHSPINSPILDPEKTCKVQLFFTHKTVSAVIYRWHRCNVLSSRQSGVNRLFIAPDDCVGRVRGSEDGGGSH